MFETNCIFEYKPSPHFRLDVVYKMGGGGVLTGHYGIYRWNIITHMQRYKRLSKKVQQSHTRDQIGHPSYYIYGAQPD